MHLRTHGDLVALVVHCLGERLGSSASVAGTLRHATDHSDLGGLPSSDVVPALLGVHRSRCKVTTTECEHVHQPQSHTFTVTFTVRMHIINSSN